VSVAEKRDFFALERGEVLGPFPARLDEADARAYLDGTAAARADDGAPIEWLPPLQLGALLVEKLVEAIEIPRGLVHTGQSLKFLRAVLPGTELTAQLRVAQVSERRGIRLSTVDLELRDADGLCVSGRASVLNAGPGRHERGNREVASIAAPSGAPTVASLTRRIDQPLVDRYAEAARDPNPIHRITAEAREGPYGRPIAHGMLVLALVSEAMTATFGERWAADGALSVRWRAPALPPLDVTASATHTGVADGRARYAVRCESGDGELLVDGTASVPLP
jgi:3-hydroxybutyryl-CoA dehydratase